MVSRRSSINNQSEIATIKEADPTAALRKRIEIGRNGMSKKNE